MLFNSIRHYLLKRKLMRVAKALHETIIIEYSAEEKHYITRFSEKTWYIAYPQKKLIIDSILNG